MNESLNKKLSELMGKFDDKILKTKINSVIEMLKNGNTDDLAKKINKLDKDELMKKIDEIDENKLKELNIDKSEIASRISDVDLNNLSKLVGENGNEIIDRIKKLLNK